MKLSNEYPTPRVFCSSVCKRMDRLGLRNSPICGTVEVIETACVAGGRSSQGMVLELVGSQPIHTRSVRLGTI